ncbi:MAG: thiamine phosphate synthase [Curvibacter lanceolatus]|uniref:thiamine phosphate synthase n=1 Tax=Curvibacter lanceolatus TaxID=86182 RepID=UPI00039D7206|nr:thiamine phosphate synthase [Curvibacter lanceolatus]MBV5294686.1 thiamine phosphate synthase [Curvibacter lanceolatus]
MTHATHADMLAQAILSTHQARFGGPGILPATSETPSLPVVQQAAWRACRALGFIDVDATCLAQAWQARTERTGRADDLSWPDQPQDFGLGRYPANQPAFATCPQALGLYVVAPDANWIARLAHMGIPTLQLRFKSQDLAAVRSEIKAALAAVRGTDVRLFINDHWQIALEEGAWGVHLGQEDLTALGAANLATLRNAGVRLGVSTHGYAEMVLADQVRPSYIAMGAVYPTTLKAMATAPQGVARLMAYADLLRRQQPPYPLVAIGGIDRERLSEVLPSGVGSVAVVRAVLAAADPQAEAQALMRAMKGSAAEA